MAVLIDADNAQPPIIDALLAKIAKYGTSSVKRIYEFGRFRSLKGERGAFYSFDSVDLAVWLYEREKCER